MGNVTVSPRLEQLSGKRPLKSWQLKESVCEKRFFEWNGMRLFRLNVRVMAGLRRLKFELVELFTVIRLNTFLKTGK